MKRILGRIEADEPALAPVSAPPLDDIQAYPSGEGERCRDISADDVII